MDLDASTCAIRTQNLYKFFGRVPVLQDITLQLEAGHLYALIGRNGVGKSTLMRILARRLAPDEGDGEVLGMALSGDDPHFNAEVVFVHENITFELPYNMGDLFGELGPMFPRWDWNAFEALVNERGIDLEQRYAALSRGQRMQVALAWALALRPRVLLLDEVTAVLDAGARHSFMRKVKDFVDAGGTVVMATNVVSEVNGLADRLIVLQDGRVRWCEPTSTITARYRRLLQPHGVSDPLFEHPACVRMSEREDGARVWLMPVEVVASLEVDPTWLDPLPPSAENVFVYHTAEDR